MASNQLLLRRAESLARREARAHMWTVTCVGLELPERTVMVSRRSKISKVLADFDYHLADLAGVVSYRLEDGTWLSGAAEEILCTPTLTIVYRTFIKPPARVLPIIGYGTDGTPYHLDLSDE